MEAKLELGKIVIRASVVELHSVADLWKKMGMLRPGFRITDAPALAMEMVRLMNEADEDGATFLNMMFGEVLYEALEQRLPGIEEADNADHK